MNVDEWVEIRRCHDEGESIKAMAERLGMSRNTVRRALSMPTPPADRRRTRGSVADDVDDRIRQLLLGSPDITVAELARQLEWDHSRTVLSRRVRSLREEIAAARRVTDLVGTVLPQQTTTFVGRRDELRELRALLGRHRVVTLAGPGGIGKTRLATEAATEFRRAFPDGVRFVSFAVSRDSSMLAQVICDALGLEGRDAHTASIEDTLVSFLAHRRMLLILDNCEHVIDSAARLVARLAEETTSVRILATSREVLSIPGEYVYRLAPLPTGDGSQSGALELFAHRAEAVLSGFGLDEDNRDDVRRICERLDGIPLAIELACSRLTVLSLRELAELLDNRVLALSSGTRDRTTRHRSLQATIDWSYELCSPDEQQLWASLSVFADGFELDAVTQVCRGDGSADIVDSMSALVSKSVVLRDTVDGRVRFRMLESIREYGAGRLTPAQQHALRTRVLDWALRTITDCAARWFSAEQVDLAALVRRNRANLRAAVQSALGDPALRGRLGDVATALGAAKFLWACGISIREQRAWINQLLSLSELDRGTVGRLLATLGLIQTLQGDRDAAEFTLRRAAELARAHNDVETWAFSLHTSGLRALFSGDFDTAAELFDAAEAEYRRHTGSAELLATLRVHQGMLAAAMLDVAGAEALFRSAHESATSVGESWFLTYATYGIGLTAWIAGDHATAIASATEALRIHRVFDDAIGTTLMTDLLGWSYASEGQGSRAAVLLGAASTLWDLVGQQLYGSDHWISLRGKALSATHAQMSDASFEVAWRRGRSMSTAELYAFVFGVDQDPATPDEDTDPRDALSPREREVADLVMAGMTNRQIAEQLVLSVRTVEGHVEHVLRKMGVGRRAELVSVSGDRHGPTTMWTNRRGAVGSV
ncbi:ATP-binding protein [Gordonia sp. NPDC058843]|uniref:ATP-binding protein n=1 Tax=Gordonia sp. NPDC058843 TaxID=3346648 RepID=UPI0036B662A3